MAVVAATLLIIVGCQSAGPAGPYTVPPECERYTWFAERLNREAADLIKRDPARAESEECEAESNRTGGDKRRANVRGRDSHVRVAGARRRTETGA